MVRGWHPYKVDEKVEFKVGTGWTMAERERLWEAREDLIGQTITYKFFPTGSKDKPRHPVFVSLRSPEDM